MSEMTIDSAAAYLLAHATPAYAPIASLPVPGQPGMSLNVSVAIEVDSGAWARALAQGNTAAWLDVLRERARQIHDKGYTPEHDDAHTDAEIVKGALSCAFMATAGHWSADTPESTCETATLLWPWDDGAPDPAKPCRAHLVQATAMLLAEIERLDRASAEARP